MDTLWLYITEKLKTIWADVILEKWYLIELSQKLLDYRIIMNWLSIIIWIIIILVWIYIFRYGKKNSNWEWDGPWYWIGLIICSMVWLIIFFIWIETLLNIYIVPELYIVNYLK